jgi:hypothetical protein
MAESADNKFKIAVAATPDLKNCYQKGLEALSPNEAKVILAEQVHCDGSVEIDECVRLEYADANRWDYCFSYKGETYFVEVHRAYENEIGVVLKKLRWLKDWLVSDAPEIHKLRAKQPYFWLPTGKCGFSQTSSQARRIALQGLKLVAKLELK